MVTFRRKYDFISGTRISSNQVDDEFNQLIDAVNKHESDLSTANDNITKAQQNAIDFAKGYGLGGVAKDITGTNLNALKETGFYYASSLIGGQPNGVGAFYVLHIQANTVRRKQFAFCALENRLWSRIYVFGNTGDKDDLGRPMIGWQSWSEITLNDDTTKTPLATGAFYMHDTQTVTPSKKLSDTRNGWIIVWSDYDQSTGTVNDFDFAYSYIPKYATTLKGKDHLFSVPCGISDTSVAHTVKKLTIYDDKITGNTYNDSINGNNGADVVLRAVLEW